jgi:hypothetical protein
MTRQELLFMLTIFAMQNAKCNRLIEILKTRGILESDDLQVFGAIVPEEVRERLEWFEEAWKAYQTTAAGLGVTTGLAWLIHQRRES